MRQHKKNFNHREALHTLPKICGASLALAFYARANNFLN
jgi:hypothetical protein